MILKIAVSGGFDPIHEGHVALMEKAFIYGAMQHLPRRDPMIPILTVILNNDNWLLKKKGYVFMPQENRKIILTALKYVHDVIITSHEPDPVDMSVCRELAELKPDLFINGGEYNPTNTLEYDFCLQHGITPVFNIVPAINSSSRLVRDVVSKYLETICPQK